MRSSGQSVMIIRTPRMIRALASGWPLPCWRRPDEGAPIRWGWPWPPLRWGIVVLGNAYLLWLASRLWQSGSLQQADSAKLQVGFVQGVGLQFLNIKAWMLALAIVAGWVAGRDDATERTLLLLPIMVT